MSEQSYRSAGTLLAQLTSGETTSAALASHYFLHMAQFNKPPDAVVQQHYALALEAVTRVDRERLEGRVRDVLYGSSCTIKKSFDVREWLTTSGTHYLKDNRATQDVPSITRLCAAGVILMGRTNVPMMTTDWQTYNDLHGTTYNLWDRQRSSGGSFEGAVMAVAADFTPVELGSDLFGSLHIPAHYTDIYTHCCNLGLILVRGHAPGGGPQATDEPDLSTTDPMTRSAADLCLMMRVLSIFRVEPPRIPNFSRYQTKANYRVCTWSSAPHHGIDQQIAQHSQLLTGKLRMQSGVEVDDAMPADIDPDALLDIAVKPGGRLISTTFNGRQRLTAGLAALGFRLVGKLADMSERIMSYYQGVLKNSDEQRSTDKLRHEYNRVIETFLARHDVLLTPVNPVLALAHMQQPVRKRKLIVDDELQDYNKYLFWSMLATVFGLPATVHPLAKTMDGLPCGIQIIPGRFHDDVAISFAKFCENISDGFAVPEGYQRWMSVTAPIRMRCV